MDISFIRLLCQQLYSPASSAEKAGEHKSNNRSLRQNSHHRQEERPSLSFILGFPVSLLFGSDLEALIMALLSLAPLLALLTVASLSTAFLVEVPRRQRTTAITTSRNTRPRMAADDPASELTSTLARLDQQWEIQQKAGPTSRWTRLILPSSDSDPSSAPVEEAPFGPISSSISPQEDFVYLLEPPSKTIPSCLIVFTGGAGLGTYPQVAYNEFLLRLSDRLNAAVITAPYNVSLDHFALAKEAGELCRRAIIHCQEDRGYPENLPMYSLSHSLGSKLSCIYAAATNQHFDGIGFISFNNFSFGRTIGMAKEFAETIRKSTGVQGVAPAGGGVTEDALNSLFSFAEMAVSAVGIDFSPTQSDMERLIQMRYGPELQKKTRLFTLDQDKLENTQEFLNACSSDSGVGPTVSGLPGTHLTPVYFKLGLDDIPDEAREMARQAAGGFQSASFGDEEELSALVDEVCGWILGRAPSRKPEWLRERPQIAASPDATENQ